MVTVLLIVGIIMMNITMYNLLLHLLQTTHMQVPLLLPPVHHLLVMQQHLQPVHHRHLLHTHPLFLLPIALSWFLQKIYHQVGLQIHVLLIILHLTHKFCMNLHHIKAHNKKLWEMDKGHLYTLLALHYYIPSHILTFKLTNLTVVPKLTKNLRSVGQFAYDNHVFFEFLFALLNHMLLRKFSSRDIEVLMVFSSFLVL